MQKFLGKYVDTYLPKFRNEIQGLKPDYAKLVNAKIDNLKQDPWHNTKPMKGQYKGRRECRINDSDRLVFISCEECREDNYTQIFRCSTCKQAPDNILTFTNIIYGHDFKGNTRW